jgi:hypothetical protein
MRRIAVVQREARLVANPTKPEKYLDLYAIVPTALSSPWDPTTHAYTPDYPLLEALIDVKVQSGDAFDPQTGALAAATNVWVATELRRAGIEADRVWPRRDAPRTLTWDAAAARAKVKIRRNPKQLPPHWNVTGPVSKADLISIQEHAIELFLTEMGKGPAVPGNSANILGGHFPKEIDVSMARYDRGLELGVSTKTMIREPTKNIPNRREEASGDLLNIRRRFPLSAFGYFFLLEHGISQTSGHFGKIVDMCRKVSLPMPGDQNHYTASCLIVAEIHQTPPTTKLHPTVAPRDLGAEQFFTALIDTLMERSQGGDHREARQLWEAAGRAP